MLLSRQEENRNGGEDMSNIDMDKVRAARRNYAKKWRAKNRERIKESNLRYWERRAEREAQEMQSKELTENDE